MSITNLLRDQRHIKLGQAQPGFAFFSTLAGGNVYANSSGIVNQTYGSSDFVQSGMSSAGWYGSAVLMSQPVVDATPYRVRLNAQVTSAELSLFIGYAPSAPTGIADIFTKSVIIPIGLGGSGKFDEVVLLPGVDEFSIDYQKAIGFGIVLSKAAGQDYASFHISVQNLAKTAPTFAASMS